MLSWPRAVECRVLELPADEGGRGAAPSAASHGRMEKDLGQGARLLRRAAASGERWCSEPGRSVEGLRLYWVWEGYMALRAELFSNLEAA